MKRQISLPTVRVSGWSYGAGRTPVPGGIGQYLEKYGVQQCVLFFAPSWCPGMIRFPLSGPWWAAAYSDANPAAGSAWHGCWQTGFRANGHLDGLPLGWFWKDRAWGHHHSGQETKRASADILPVLGLKFNSWINQNCQHGTFCQHKMAFKVGREMSM